MLILLVEVNDHEKKKNRVTSTYQIMHGKKSHLFNNPVVPYGGSTNVTKPSFLSRNLVLYDCNNLKRLHQEGDCYGLVGKVFVTRKPTTLEHASLLRYVQHGLYVVTLHNPLLPLVAFQ